MLEVAAADTELSYGLAGQLYASHSGWLLLQIPNDIGNGAFAALAETGVEQPKQTGGNYNAHISVMTADEVQSLGGPDAIRERGQSFHYTTGRVRTVKPLRWNGVSKVWFIECHSPELKQLRKSYGLTPLPNGSHQFHCTFAIRPTRKNFDAADAAGKLAEDDNWNLATCCYRPERHCNCEAATTVKLAEHLIRLQPAELKLRKIAELVGNLETYFAPEVKLASGEIWSHLAIPGGVAFCGWNKLASQLGGNTLVSDLPSFDAPYYLVGRSEYPDTAAALYRQLSVAFVVGGGGITHGAMSKAAAADSGPWSQEENRYSAGAENRPSGLPSFLRMNLAEFNASSAIKLANDLRVPGITPSDRHLIQTTLRVAECMPGGETGKITAEQLSALAVGLYKRAEFGETACAEICRALACLPEHGGLLLTYAVKNLLS